MAGRWMDEREERDRMDPERRYGRRYRREEFGPGDFAAPDYEERSFRPRDLERRSVFGERETGTDYAGPRRGAGGYYGYGATLGGRYYGDDGRRRIYPEEYAPYTSGPSAYGGRRYSADRRGPDRWREAHPYAGPEAEHAGRDDEADHRNFWERTSDRVASWFGEGDYERGEHRGRGPSGYKRTDERISDEVNERLTEDPWLDASNISVSVSGGEVTLNGTVPEREAKHRAERLIEDMSGVTHVQNNLRVRKGDPITGAGSGFGDSANAAQMSAATRAKN